MFLAETKASFVKGLRDTFDANYPEADFQGLRVSAEYPVGEQDYPGIWVDFNVVSLRRAGIAHEEYVEVTDPVTLATSTHAVQRFRFTGTTQLTVVALTSLERERLFDEVVKVVAFGSTNDTERGALRDYIENGDLVAMSVDWDEFSVGGMAAVPGTPWGTDEIIYEATITIETIGEFISDPSTASLASLSAVTTFPYKEGDPDPTEGGGWV